MTGIASTTANLALWRLQWETLFSLPHLLDESEMDDEEGCRLSEIEHFGDNPGNLRMFQYVPDNLPPNAPLVVVLHGCTQTAAGYDRSSGWSWLAQEHGFAVLFAQQRGENNPRRCFNWFRPSDIVRDGGEAASIRHMVTWLADRHDIDRQRIFVTGLSAGGAMANVMLSAYPDVFAAGAIIAGLPYRSAKSVHDALQVMMEGVSRTPEAWGAEVRAASPLGSLADSRIAAPWPRVAVWQGLADDVVRPSNAVEIVKQWTDVHGFGEQATEEEEGGGTKRMRWRNAEGEVVVEAVAIEHLGHAVPIDAARLDLHEQPGPHFADIGLSSTLEIAHFFGLVRAEAPPRVKGEGKKADQKSASRKSSAGKAGASGATVLTSALAALPSGLRSRRPRVRGRDGTARPRPGAGPQPPVLTDDDEGLPPPETVTVTTPVAERLPLSQGEAQAASAKAEVKDVPVQQQETPVHEAEDHDSSANGRGEPDRGIFDRIMRMLGFSGKD